MANKIYSQALLLDVTESVSQQGGVLEYLI